MEIRIIGMTLLVIMGLGFYFMPAIISWDKKDRDGIFILNLLLGWTLIGWVAALVWGVSSSVKQKEPKYFEYACPKCGYVSKLDQHVKLHVCPQCRTETPHSNAPEEESKNSKKQSAWEWLTNPDKGR